MTETKHNATSSGGYEKRDVNVPVTMFWAAIVVLVIVFAVIKVDEYVTYLKEKATYENELKPENPALLTLRERETTELTTYGVVDSAKAVYRIPIDSAMAQVVEQYKADRHTLDSGVSPASGNSK